MELVCAKFSYLSVLDIYDIYGLRFYHTDRRQSGETVLSSEERPILEGSDPYITSGIGSGGIQRRAFHAVHNQKDEVTGLNLVSQIVKEHGGEINIDTETDEGSIITVSIERKEPKHV